MSDNELKETLADAALIFQHPPRTFTSTSTATTISVLGPFAGAGGCASGPGPVTLVRQQSRYRLRAKPGLEHNLFFVMGFMEMANAWDFAANVWNTEPVPVFATALMALGGTIAGVFSLFTMRDAWLAWHNVCFLREQRRGLLEVRAAWLKAAPAAPVTDIDAFLEVGRRELGTELICRFLLDIFMGFGAVLISIGTYMAIGGRNPTIYEISNLLSGYVGNAPIALVGVLISVWVVHLFRKAQAHLEAARAVLPGTRAAELVRRRTRNVQVWCVTTGVTTIVGGVGSMLTATRWWGYVILLPVIASAVFCNVWWRSRVGYARHDLVGTAGRSVVLGHGGGGTSASMGILDELSTALESAARAEMSVRQNRAAPLSGLVSDPTSLAQVVHFLAGEDLLGPYCERVANDAKLHAAVCGSTGGFGGPRAEAKEAIEAEADEITLDVGALCKLPEAVHGAAIERAQELLRDVGTEHFRFRERHAAELLGSCAYLLQAGIGGDGEKDGGEESGRRR
ncbi:hypothetical protein ESCO_004915 [Escovopsis weberi]|uniref:Integral membrane protein n=1 Tax=Escovopsis weberi TaxID=150374 RepID=A0A0M8MRA7_ESCWE|nr:hypothetical protein ESCO_004915 [Escovopsis weberi]